MELRAQLDVIRRRGLLILLSVLITTSGAVGFTAATPRNYEAEATLLIGNAAGSATPTLDQVLLSQRISVTYADLATQRATLDRVIQRLQLADTTAEDLGSYFPLAALRRGVQAGRIAALAPRFHGLPTNRSQRATLDTDVPELVVRCRDDAVDAVLLVPNCPVCHQSVSLAARALERAGIATVVMGCAKDIVEYAAAPRFLFSDFPLGNSAGRPHDPESQALTLELALRLLESAPGARTTMQSPLRWSEDASWKLDYNNVAQLSPEELARRRAEFDKQKDIARGNRAA